MNRINIEEVIESYKKNGIKPIRSSWVRLDEFSLPTCACGLGIGRKRICKRL